MSVKVLPVVNKDDINPQTELDYHDFEVAPQVGDTVQVTHKPAPNTTRHVSGLVTKVEHRGSAEQSRDKACILIWINILPGGLQY